MNENNTLLDNGLINGDKAVSLFRAKKPGLEDLIFIETEHKDIIFTNKEMKDFWQLEYDSEKGLVINDENKVENSMNNLDKPEMDKVTKKILHFAEKYCNKDLIGINFETYKGQIRYMIENNAQNIFEINEDDLTKKLASYMQNHDSIEPFARTARANTRIGRKKIVLYFKKSNGEYFPMNTELRKEFLDLLENSKKLKYKEVNGFFDKKDVIAKQAVVVPTGKSIEFQKCLGISDDNPYINMEEFKKNYVTFSEDIQPAAVAQPYKRKEAHSVFESMSAGLESYKGKIALAGASVKANVQGAYSKSASFLKKDAEQTATDFKSMGNCVQSIYASLGNSFKSAYLSASDFLKKDIKLPVNKIVKTTALAALAGVLFLTTAPLKEEQRSARSEQAKPALQTQSTQELKFPKVIAPTQQPQQEYKFPEVVVQALQVIAPKLIFPDSKTKRINGFKTAKMETSASLSKMYDISEQEDVFGFKIDVKGDADEVYSFCDSGPVYATPLVSGTADVRMKNCDGKVNVIAAKKIRDGKKPIIYWEASWKYDRKNDAEQRYAKVAKQVQAQLKAFYESEPTAEAKSSSFNSTLNSGIEEKLAVEMPESGAADDSLDYFGIGNVKNDIEKLVSHRNMNNKRSMDWIAVTSGVSWVKDRETAYGGLKAGVNIGLALNRYDANVAPAEMKDEMTREYALNTEQSLDSIAKVIGSKYGIKVSASTIRNSARKALGSNVSRKDGSAKSAYFTNF